MNRWTAVLADEITFGGEGNPIRFETAPTGLGIDAMDTNDQKRLGRRGVLAGWDEAAEKEIALPLQVLGNSPVHAEQVTWQIVAAFRPRKTDVPLLLKLEDREMLFRGRPRRCQPDFDRLGKSARVLVPCSFVATDPVAYSTTENLVTVVLAPPGSTGLSWPLSWPLTWGSSSYTPTLVQNDGAASAPWTATIYGPAVFPRLTNRAADGRWIGWDVTLGPGDRLDIDSDNRTVLLNGTESRFMAVGVGARWWELEPGPNEIVLTHAGAYDPATRADIRWRSATY